jgi:hypothetical protein
MPFDGSTYEVRARSLSQIDKVIDLLSDERRWCKQRLQTPDGRYCILGAMKAVGAEIGLKAPILLAIEQVTGRYAVRIEMFNDHPRTTHAVVLKVLHQARQNIADPTVGAAKPKATTAWARLRGVFA